MAQQCLLAKKILKQFNQINMSKELGLILIITITYQLKAQSQVEKFLNISIGYGLTEGLYGSEDTDEAPVIGTGFFAQGEYIFKYCNWFELRPYAGFLNAKANDDKDLYYDYGYKAHATALLLGGKFRITAPIPYIAPYFETGIGASIGSFETKTRYWDIDTHGVFGHIPLNFGVKIGHDHEYEIAFIYYIQPKIEQISGAMAFGITIPI